MSDTLCRTERLTPMTAYWVCAFRDEPARVNASWIFAPGQPPSPVPNPSMHWRRPTAQEVADRQRWWESNPEKAMRYMADAAGRHRPVKWRGGRERHRRAVAPGHWWHGLPIVSAEQDALVRVLPVMEATGGSS